MNMFVRSTAIAICATIAPAFAIAQEGDVAAGKSVFKKCAACHFYDKEKKKSGPHLVGIVGRAAGSIKGHKYSKGMKKAAQEGLVWTEENLDKYLKAPRKFIKGGNMAFGGLRKEKDRKNIIAFLKAEAKKKDE